MVWSAPNHRNHRNPRRDRSSRAVGPTIGSTAGQQSSFRGSAPRAGVGRWRRVWLSGRGGMRRGSRLGCPINNRRKGCRGCQCVRCAPLPQCVRPVQQHEVAGRSFHQGADGRLFALTMINPPLAGAGPGLSGVVTAHCTPTQRGQQMFNGDSPDHCGAFSRAVHLHWVRGGFPSTG